uniref:GIY-YIG nuclease family protein n=1 Tax=Ralstonia solanacearum TaxID=305 RepID=A0A0S4TP76_RALSL|nr:conserved protein of unknown function [Ralstonia solanacearum]
MEPSERDRYGLSGCADTAGEPMAYDGNRRESSNRSTMTAKKDYQRLINAGAIADMAGLLTFATEQGLIVAKRGDAYITIKGSGPRRFRLFLASHHKAGRAGMPTATGVAYDFWIYALVAHDLIESACYIGQTRAVVRRMREHWKLRAGERGSSPLFDWATERGLTVHVVLLQALSGIQSDADRAEAEWLACAAAAGYELPGVDVWAPRGARQRPGLVWPSVAIRGSSRPLEQVAAGTTRLVRLSKNSVLVDHRPEELRLE